MIHIKDFFIKKVVGSKTLEEEVEKELLQNDPEKEKARAILCECSKDDGE